MAGNNKGSFLIIAGSALMVAFSLASWNMADTQGLTYEEAITRIDSMPEWASHPSIEQYKDETGDCSIRYDYPLQDERELQISVGGTHLTYISEYVPVQCDDLHLAFVMLKNSHDVSYVTKVNVNFPGALKIAMKKLIENALKPENGGPDQEITMSPALMERTTPKP